MSVKQFFLMWLIQAAIGAVIDVVNTVIGMYGIALEVLLRAWFVWMLIFATAYWSTVSLRSKKQRYGVMFVLQALLGLVVTFGFPWGIQLNALSAIYVTTLVTFSLAYWITLFVAPDRRYY